MADKEGTLPLDASRIKLKGNIMTVRVPQPKEQARILTERLRAEGLSLGHQKALDIVAALNGHRSWHVMARAGEADKPEKQPVLVCGFGVDDVQSVRPELTDKEAELVLRYCEREFDASLGLNWDRLEALSLQVMPPLYVPVELRLTDGRRESASLELHSGRFWLGAPQELPSWGRQEPEGCHLAGTQVHISGPHGQALELALGANADLFGGLTDELQALCEQLRDLGVPFVEAGKDC